MKREYILLIAVGVPLLVIRLILPYVVLNYANRALANLKVFFAGRVAEKLSCDDISSGASNDIQRATALARMMVCDWGMSDALGPVSYRHDESGAVWEGLPQLFSCVAAVMVRAATFLSTGPQQRRRSKMAARPC